MRYLQHVCVLWRAAPAWSTLALTLTVLEAVTRTLLMVGVGHFVGSFAAAGSTWRWFAVVAVLLLVGPVLQSLLSMVTARCSAAYLAYVFDLVAGVGVHPHGIGHLDTPGFSSRLQAVVDATRDWSFVSGVNATWSIIGPRLAGLGAIVLLLPWRWWVPFVVAASFLLVSRVFMGWISLAFDKLLETTGDERRRAGYLRGLLTQPESAKEVRLFGLVDWLADNYRSTWFEAMTRLWLARRSGLGPVLSACLVMALMVGGALVLIGVDVAAGTVSLAGAVTMTQAILRLQNFGVLGDAGTALARNTSALQALVELRREVDLPAIEPAPTSPAVRAASGGAAEVRLARVSFGYPGRETLALSEVNLRIPAGQSVELTAQRAVGVGEIAVLDDNERVRQALHDGAAEDVVAALPEGLATQLGATWPDGVDPSGGQWQRIAIARGMMRQAPLLIVLDEPTSALDAATEHALFERYAAAGWDGGVTLLVTHRFSTVAAADFVVVLDQGRVIENGSHAELIANQGHYAELYQLQARGYR